jgi:hydroxyethylthiazole kinase-like uncharacterized protein yjeF
LEVNDSLLRRWPLPSYDGAADKESRGHVLVVAGSREMPGAAWLAATGALRAGAGKLVVATGASVATGLALMLPESRVIALPESSAGGLRTSGLDSIRESLDCVDAVLLGPGWTDKATSHAFTQKVLDAARAQTPVVLDAMAMDGIDQVTARGLRLLTPHAGEMAHLWDVTKAEVLAHSQEFCVMTAERWQCVVALKGATTFVATPDGSLWCHQAARPGLGTSGSGDALAGVIAGVVARGATLAQAAVWGVALHSRAGSALAATRGPIGFLASELLVKIPALMHLLSRRRGGSK